MRLIAPRTSGTAEGEEADRGASGRVGCSPIAAGCCAVAARSAVCIAQLGRTRCAIAARGDEADEAVASSGWSQLAAMPLDPRPHPRTYPRSRDDTFTRRFRCGGTGGARRAAAEAAPCSAGAVRACGQGRGCCWQRRRRGACWQRRRRAKRLAHRSCLMCYSRATGFTARRQQLTVGSAAQVWLEYVFGICKPDGRIGKGGSKYVVGSRFLVKIVMSDFKSIFNVVVVFLCVS